MIAQLNGLLGQLRPFVQMVALLFAFMAAFKGLAELLPVLNQIVAIKGDAQRLALIAGALALASGGGR
jgi:hypothetical protein